MLASNNAASNEDVRHVNAIWHHQKLAAGYHIYQADSDEELPVEMASDIHDFEFAVYRFSFLESSGDFRKCMGQRIRDLMPLADS